MNLTPDDVAGPGELRCPFCQTPVTSQQIYSILESGTHELTCGNCQRQFQVTTDFQKKQKPEEGQS